MSDDDMRHIPLTGVQNFRDLGGYPAADGRKTRWGRLFRSGHLSDMTEACGTELLARDIETVIDFRTDDEKKHHPVHWTAMWSPTYCPIPIGGNAAAWIRETFERMKTSPIAKAELRGRLLDAYRTIPVNNADGLKRFFEILLDQHEGNGALFHCAAGKDRTGIAAALALTILGVDDDCIMEDYLFTNVAVDLEVAAGRIAEIVSLKAGITVGAADLYPLVGVEADFLNTCFATIRTEFGSMNSYIEKALGMTPDRIEAFQQKFLSDT